MNNKLTPCIHRIKYDAAKGKPSKARQTRLLLSARLKIMLTDLGLTPETAGKMLHVHPRTVRYWISGKTLIPYSAYRLLAAVQCLGIPYHQFLESLIKSASVTKKECHKTAFKKNYKNYKKLQLK